MEDEVGLQKLFYELSSESRLGILRVLLSENLRMQEVARRLNLTDAEAFRQLQRLSSARMVQRQPDGSYAVTPYAKLEMQLTRSLEFVYTNRDYFMDHNIWSLPSPFIERISELSGTHLLMEPLSSISRAEQIISEAEEYHWGIGEGQATRTMGLAAREQVNKGVELRILSPMPKEKRGNVENRTLMNTPVFMVLTEKEAIVCLRFNDGRMDYAGFYGKDETFLSWVKDMFLFYWDRSLHP